MSDRSAETPAPDRVSAVTVAGLRVGLRPEFGGKVTTLRWGSEGREWLAPPVRDPRRPDRPDQGWGELDCSGWDECFPNIGASVTRGLLDHGAVWRHPWRSGGAEAPLAASVRPPGAGFRFTREITPTEYELRVSYQIENLSHADLTWAWAQHPLLAVDPATRIVLAEPARVRLDSASHDGVSSTELDWLCPGGMMAADTVLTGAVGRAAKVWFTPPLPAVVAVVRGSEWLAWRVAESTAPDLGLWVNIGGWGELPLRHVAVEPAFGAHDNPDTDWANGTSQVLAPGQRRQWQVLISAGSGFDSLGALLTAHPPAATTREPDVAELPGAFPDNSRRQPFWPGQRRTTRRAPEPAFPQPRALSALGGC